MLVAIAQGRSVLDLGCTNHPYTDISIADGTLLHARLAAVATGLVGIDADVQGIEELRKYSFGELIHGSLEKLNEVQLDRTFEVVIAGEVIEHLLNPGKFLEGVMRFMNAESRLVITTVNAYSVMRFAQYAFRGRGGIAEPVHPDHVAYFSYKTLSLMLKKAGFRIEAFAFYDLGKEHRVHSRPILNFINDVGVYFAPQLADGLVAVCVKDS